MSARERPASAAFRVIVKNGWSYVVDEDGCKAGEWSGPWRYQWEAQDYADELNANPHASGGPVSQ